MIEFQAVIFAWFVLSDRPPAPWGLIHLERGGMPFHDGVGKNAKKSATTEIKAQQTSICAKGCMLDDCESIK